MFAENVVAKGDKIKLPLYEKAQILVERIPDLIKEYNGTLRFQKEPPLFLFTRRPNDKESILKKLERLLADMEGLLPDRLK